MTLMIYGETVPWWQLAAFGLWIGWLFYQSDRRYQYLKSQIEAIRHGL